MANVASNSSAGHSLFGAQAAAPRGAAYDSEESRHDPTIEDTIVPNLPSLATQESEWSESGLTATYDIPSLRTISPSFTSRRHKIASVTLKDIHLSYLFVPKNSAPPPSSKPPCAIPRPSPSSKGPVGLTLDGSSSATPISPAAAAATPSASL